MPVPGADYGFLTFSAVAMGPEAIVFQASAQEGSGGYIQGIYGEIAGTLVRVIDSADPLEGKPTWSFGTGPNALDGHRVAMRVQFEDDSQAVYLATICLADLDGDGAVEWVDLDTLLSNYGASGMGEEDGDINGDGVVNLSDLAVLLSNFGQICW